MIKYPFLQQCEAGCRQLCPWWQGLPLVLQSVLLSHPPCLHKIYEKQFWSINDHQSVPHSAAQWSGVPPSMSAALMLMPGIFRSSLTVLKWPENYFEITFFNFVDLFRVFLSFSLLSSFLLLLLFLSKYQKSLYFLFGNQTWYAYLVHFLGASWNVDWQSFK